jgi:hypothetical protein
VSERSRAKSSAANIKPDKYGEALQILERSDRALADSMRANSLIGGAEAFEAEEEGWRSGNLCLMTSVTKCKSEAELTFGITMASRSETFSCR